MCRRSLNWSTLFSPETRNFRKDFPWKRQLWEIESNRRYCRATRLKKLPEIFLCTARCLLALSAMLLFQGIPSSSRKRNRLSLYRINRFWYFWVISLLYSRPRMTFLYYRSTFCPCLLRWHRFRPYLSTSATIGTSTSRKAPRKLSNSKSKGFFHKSSFKSRIR